MGCVGGLRLSGPLLLPLPPPFPFPGDGYVTGEVAGAARTFPGSGPGDKGWDGSRGRSDLLRGRGPGIGPPGPLGGNPRSGPGGDVGRVTRRDGSCVPSKSSRRVGGAPSPWRALPRGGGACRSPRRASPWRRRSLLGPIRPWGPPGGATHHGARDVGGPGPLKARDAVGLDAPVRGSVRGGSPVPGMVIPPARGICRPPGGTRGPVPGPIYWSSGG